jgi:hypothetical protein
MIQLLIRIVCRAFRLSTANGRAISKENFDIKVCVPELSLLKGQQQR